MHARKNYMLIQITLYRRCFTDNVLLSNVRQAVTRQVAGRLGEFRRQLTRYWTSASARRPRLAKADITPLTGPFELLKWLTFLWS